MPVQIEVFSDYVCPYCFLAEVPLQEAIRGKDVAVEWMPFELRPYPHPTLKPEGSYLQQVWRDSVYPLAQRLGLPIQLPTISPQPYTHLAFEGYQYARQAGKGEAYNHRILQAFFQEDQDIGQIEVLTQLAAEVGLDRTDFKHALETRQYRAAHQEALHHAQELQVTSVPTFVIGSQILPGLPSRGSLERAIHLAAAGATQ